MYASNRTDFNPGRPWRLQEVQDWRRKLIRYDLFSKKEARLIFHDGSVFAYFTIQCELKSDGPMKKNITATLR